MGEGDRIKVAIIGAGREGLETLSLLRKDKAVSVSILLDPDQKALGFRLEEYGYTYSSDLNLRFSHRIRELLTLQDLNLIINTLPDRHHKDLYDLNLYPAEIINGDSAMFLWGLRQINEIEKRRSMITGQIGRGMRQIRSAGMLQGISGSGRERGRPPEVGVRSGLSRLLKDLKLLACCGYFIRPQIRIS